MTTEALAVAARRADAARTLSDSPVFIGGLAGSGKTPLRILLSDCTGLVLTRRTYFWTRVYNRFGDLRDPANFERCLEAILANPHVRVLQPDPQRLRQAFAAGERTYARLFALVHAQHAELEGKQRWGNQEGAVERYADEIFAAYPAARMVHLLRDPGSWCGAVCAPAGRKMGALGWHLARWLKSARLAGRNRRLYPEHYMVLTYEQLTRSPEEALQAVCAFVGEAYQPDGLDLSAIGTAEPPALPPHAARFITRAASREMRALGYDLAAGGPVAGGSLLALADGAANRAGLIARQLYDAYHEWTGER